MQQQPTAPLVGWCSNRCSDASPGRSRPPCASCASGNLGNCERLAFGCVEPGLQTGFCCDTGGGWGTAMVAHASQLHTVPESNERRGRGARRAHGVRGPRCASGRARGRPDRRGVRRRDARPADHRRAAPVRRRRAPSSPRPATPNRPAWPSVFGADRVCTSDELPRIIRSMTKSMAYGAQLTGGATPSSIAWATTHSIAQGLAVVRPRGRVVLVGMPGKVKVELTTLWHRETNLVGAYAYGTETLARRRPAADLRPGLRTRASRPDSGACCPRPTHCPSTATPSSTRQPQVAEAA